MSEIQRKLDLLQVLDSRHHIAVSSGDVVPVHRESHYNNNNQHNYDEFYSANPSHHTNERDSSRRTRSRSNSSNRQQQQPPPQPPPPPPPPPPPLPSVDLNDSLDSAKTLAYLSELEMLARHWRTQLLYKVLQDSFILISSFHIYNFLIECIFSLLQQVELKSPNKRMMGTVLENDSFQCWDSACTNNEKNYFLFSFTFFLFFFCFFKAEISSYLTNQKNPKYFTIYLKKEKKCLYIMYSQQTTFVIKKEKTRNQVAYSSTLFSLVYLHSTRGLGGLLWINICIDIWSCLYVYDRPKFINNNSLVSIFHHLLLPAVEGHAQQ